MSIKNDLGLAYHMGYDDALAKRKPDASKTQVLAPYDLATENPDGVDARYLGLTANKLAKIATDLKSENAKLRESLGEGAGTCKAVYSPNGVYCSVCHGGGLTIPRRGVNALRNFCPNCGRKVVGE